MNYYLNENAAAVHHHRRGVFYADPASGPGQPEQGCVGKASHSSPEERGQWKELARAGDDNYDRLSFPPRLV
jgi:hypothetical protein